MDRITLDERYVEWQRRRRDSHAVTRELLREVVSICRDADEKSPLFAENFHSDWSFLKSPPIATVLYGLDIPPVGGDTFFVEVWMRDLLDVDLTDSGIASRGISKGSVDIQFENQFSQAVAVSHNGIFDLSFSFRGTIDQDAGRIEDFSGRTIAQGRGVTPSYGRLGYIEFVATAQGQQQVALQGVSLAISFVFGLSTLAALPSNFSPAHPIFPKGIVRGGCSKSAFHLLFRASFAMAPMSSISN